MFSGREEKDMCKNTSSKSARKTSSVIHGNSSSIFMSFFIRPWEFIKTIKYYSKDNVGFQKRI